MHAALAIVAPLLISGAPGEVLHGTLPARTTTVRAVDATTRNATGIAYLTDRAAAGAARWVSLDHGAYTVRVPRDAKPGQYFVGLAGGVRVVPLEIDVRGPQVARFVLGTVHAGPKRLFLHVNNAGNVLRRPTGVVAVQSQHGKVLARVSFRMASFLPHTAVDYPLPLKTALRPGTYVASVQLAYPGVGSDGRQTSTAAPSFTVSAAPSFRPHAPTTPRAPAAGGESASPWPWLAAAIGVALAAAGAWAVVALRRRRPVTVAVTPVAALAPPDPEQLCEGFHYWQVDWEHPEPAPGGGTAYRHRCRRCGLEVRATDIGDAAAKAEALL